VPRVVAPGTSAVRAQRRQVLGAVALALSGASLAGCGFQLRGVTELPFRTFYSSVAQTSPFGGEMRRAIRTNGATVVERREDAEVRFDLLSEAIEREISALSTSGRPREFQLRYRIRWHVRDTAERDLIPATEMLLRRSITVLDVQGLVNPDEEALLFRDMRIDAVNQILRRLSTLKGLP
jgi:LPS-assembly lipoprotein